MRRKKLTENSQGEPVPNQTKLRQAAAHTIFSFLFFSFKISLSTNSSRLRMNSEIMELDWHRTQLVTENFNNHTVEIDKAGDVT